MFSFQKKIEKYVINHKYFCLLKHDRQTDGPSKLCTEFLLDLGILNSSQENVIYPFYWFTDAQTNYKLNYRVASVQKKGLKVMRTRGCGKKKLLKEETKLHPRHQPYCLGTKMPRDGEKHLIRPPPVHPFVCMLHLFLYFSFLSLFFGGAGMRILIKKNILSF